MIRAILRSILNSKALKSNNLLICREIRSMPRRGTEPKFVEGKVKTVTNFEDDSRIETYDDYVDSLKKSKLGDELQVEKDFVEEEDFGDATERCGQFYDMHVMEEKLMKSTIKKQIVKRKYFKLDKETCLLTHAAKEQIRFLHKSNPLEWNCKALAECFPISEAGVKKLLESNFTQTDPEKIKAHDEDVAEKWKCLKSGTTTTYISPRTYQLYKEGKLVDDYFCGNPNLPTAPHNIKKIQVRQKTYVGEFSAIVQTYAAYEKQKLLGCGKDDSESQVTLRATSDAGVNKKIDYKDIKKFKYASEEFDDENTKRIASYKNYNKDNADLPLSQFKELLKEEAKYKSQKDGYMSSEENNFKTSKKPIISQNCFLKISKYDKNQNINAMYDRQKNMKVVYKYDDKLGYQYPAGKTVKGKIYLSPQQYKKGKLYKVGKCVYDDDGELLYKVPT